MTLYEKSCLGFNVKRHEVGDNSPNPSLFTGSLGLASWPISETSKESRICLVVRRLIIPWAFREPYNTRFHAM